MTNKIVVPGELVSDVRKQLGEHVFVRDNKIFSDALGIAKTDGSRAFVVPLQGAYLPHQNDLVVGIVASDVYAGYLIDINTPQPAFVSKKELRDPLKIGTIVSAKIMETNEVRDVQLGFVRVFYGGRVVSVSAVKVPRMIGKNGSMLDVLKRGTGCSLMIGRNGWVWVKGGDAIKLKRALDKIEREAHLPDLTNKMAAFLKN